MADLALVLQLGQRADGVLDRHAAVDGVELIEVDALALEALAGWPRRPARRCSGRQSASQRPALGRIRPPLVAMTRPAG